MSFLLTHVSKASPPDPSASASAARKRFTDASAAAERESAKLHRMARDLHRKEQALAAAKAEITDQATAAAEAQRAQAEALAALQASQAAETATAENVENVEMGDGSSAGGKRGLVVDAGDADLGTQYGSADGSVAGSVGKRRKRGFKVDTVMSETDVRAAASKADALLQAAKRAVAARAERAASSGGPTGLSQTQPAADATAAAAAAAAAAASPAGGGPPGATPNAPAGP